jgi:hypothetical protein
MWKTISEGTTSPNEDILINVEAFRGAVRKGDWKLVKIALLPGKTELFKLRSDPGEEQCRRGEPGNRQRSGDSPRRLCKTAENEQMAQGAASVSRRAGQDDPRS